MQKNVIIEKLKERGCRITKQRLILLDIILENQCSCCKEIYYKASRIDDGIGTATVYRMMNTLEEIGAINRKNVYQLAPAEEDFSDEDYEIKLEDGSTLMFTNQDWQSVIRAGLIAGGYIRNEEAFLVMAK
jgi:Fur family ferric uptake transcriptional regulator